MNPPPSAAEWFLRRSDGREIPFTIGIGEPVLLGRDLDVAIPILEPGVSRHHAVFEYDGEALVLRDLESQNGTLINAARITSSPVRAGDVITVGGVSLVLGQRHSTASEDDTSRALHHLSREDLVRLAASARELSTRHGHIEQRLLNVALRLVNATRGVVFVYDAATQLRAAAVVPEHFHGAIARLTTSLGASVSVSNRGQRLDVGRAVALPLPENRGILYLERSDDPFESGSLDLLRALLWISAPSLTGHTSTTEEAATLAAGKTVTLTTEA